LNNKTKLDKIAKSYHLGNKLNDMRLENLNQIFYSNWILKFVKNKSVLEMGYGDGILTSYLASRKNSNLNLIEGSKLLSKKAKRKHKNITVINEMFENFKPKKKYDIIIASHILEHVDKPVEVLKKIKSWMHKKSLCIIHVPISTSYHRQIAVIMKLQKKLDTLSKRDLVVGHKRVYSLKTMKSDLKKTRFRLLKIQGFFLKFLPNSMMLDFSDDLIVALNKITKNIDPALCANASFIIKKK
jgi:2-polyprenyl-3-methyl-5-hydroxy-6-metoxy-1,4-benzoquinol methylase